LNPSNASLSDIAHQIVQNRAIENIQFYVVYATLALVILALGCIVRAYFSEKGKLMAAAASLNQRLDEIRQSTDAAEKIKVQIAHNDWTLKELKTLRRNKLEELITSAYKVLFSTEADSSLPTEDHTFEVKSRICLAELRQTSALYFPEFEKETEAIATAHSGFASWFLDEKGKIRQKQVRVKSETKSYELISGVPGQTVNGITHTAQLATVRSMYEELEVLQTAYTKGYAGYHFELRRGIKSLETRATALMAELIAPTVG
jgi:hypothetical protein